ncbi:MAG: hypothetical protein NZ529_06630 [Cytophagaceae bacterium]|nr:hypothetical protein [Cytophagaceae bacterium]MDW8456455.1 hypothetical protein [Cytophagaceae bacterium]
MPRTICISVCMFGLFICSSCRKDRFNFYTGKYTFETFTIKAGTHRSTQKVSLLQRKQLKFIAYFDSSAIYTLSDSVEQYDINKLFGFSDCGTLHEQNSARFGWRYLNNRIEIFAYVYCNGVRHTQYLTCVSPFEQVIYQIIAENNFYIFNVKDAYAELPRACNDEHNIKYHLFPYFGGTLEAPHDINIYIKEIN